MTIEEMKSRKTSLGLTNEMISEACGIPLSTIQKIMSGTTKAPRKATLEAIEKVLYTEEHRRKIHTPEILKEPSAEYNISGSSVKKKGGYTLDDYYALPDEQRVELIDGVFYDMAAPAVIHQKILGELFILFRECINAHKAQCDVYLSPCDVRLDRDNRTMVQPDLFVICGSYDLDARAFDGAPDLTLEILSPSTRAKDMLLKLHKYQNAGVKEYWIVDPEHNTVLVYDLGSGDFYPAKYSFDDVIPIRISGGKCSIDFSQVNKALARIRDR
ncbi:MAG: Uma2 family endonuclease [Lachnospiraceae bacterium]|nr:Uma2 family endonuclease [Lachnospiraceae bacterium]